MGRFEDHGVRFVMSQWPPDDVDGAREWVERKMAAEGNAMPGCYVSDVGRMWARTDPVRAIDWMLSLDERSQKGKTIITATPNLHRAEPALVRQRLPDSSLTEAAQSAILSEK